MKTTLVLPDELAKRLKERAMHEGRSMSSLVEEALVRWLADVPQNAPPDLPLFSAGAPTVDIADRNALAARMDSQ